MDPSAGCCFPVSQVSEAPLAGFDTTLFLWVQKVTLETAVFGLESLERPAGPSAGCCFPFRRVSEAPRAGLETTFFYGFRKSR